MSLYSIGKVAKLSGVSKRTLHHYHEIGLLVPDGKSLSGYRLYSSRNLMKLQQIMLYRNCGMPLADIQMLVSDTPEHHIALLENQLERLQNQIALHQSQLNTLNKTLKRLKGDDMAITDSELYKGFGEQAQDIRNEAIEKWGDEVIEVENKLLSSGESTITDVKAQGEAIALEISQKLQFKPSDDLIQNLTLKQFNWLSNFYPVTKERFEALANLYVDDSRFCEFYDKYQEGTAKLLRDAMLYFASKRQWN